MKTRLEKAVSYIRGYCDKHDDCKKCRLYGDNIEFCSLRGKMPCDWEFKENKDGK